ncbi:MAG: hypothetical protein GXO02_00420, partial [Epsilonproteobacteria bacterium]|nr:hypothetical protein [Campylobacterota bacterium]
MEKILNIIKRYQTSVLIVVAFIFSLTIHLMWQFVFGDNPLYYWNGTLMINTNDGYYFASGVQKELYGMHQPNPLVPSIYDRGLVFVTYFLAKFLPFSLDTIIFYMPAFISSLVVIPLVLIGKLYNKPLWGFFSALVASIAWSYYNRTLVGYYDTDMFALILPVFILYFFLKSIKSFNLRDTLIASLLITLYGFLYIPGKVVAYALGFIYIFYLIYLYFIEKKDKELLLKFAILVLVALSSFYMPIFIETIFKSILLIGIYFLLSKKSFPTKSLFIASIVAFLYFFISTDALLSIYNRVVGYTATGTSKEGLHFFQVLQTVSEATGIPIFPDGSGRSNVAYRVIGSTAGFLIFIAGYILLIVRHKEFILALPLVAIGLFAHWGGLRFTIYAVPIAALSSIYLICQVANYLFSNSKRETLFKYGFIILATIGLLYPNIAHTLKYNPGVVFNRYEVEDLVKLNTISNPKDYTLTWWDYGYPIWYYSDTISLIDGGKHNEDNFIISKIFLSTSPLFAANFSRVAVEKFAQSAKSYQEYKKRGENEEDIPEEFKLINNGEVTHSGTGPIIKALLRVN